MYLDDLIRELGVDQRKRAQEEMKLHKQVAQFLRWAVPADCVWYHVPNGGKRSKKVGGEMAAMGLKAGIPDLAFVYQGRALFIELKAPAGRVSADQRQMFAKLERAGTHVEVCTTPEEVVAVLEGWGLRLQAELTA